jgi:hypothetical protein
MEHGLQKAVRSPLSLAAMEWGRTICPPAPAPQWPGVGMFWRDYAWR